MHYCILLKTEETDMKRINVSDMLYDRIIQDFLDDEISFGEKFVELEYAEKLNVSRTPLREAIKKLEHEGLILRLPNGRLKFLDIHKADVIEIFNIRVALENMLLEQCINNKNSLEELKENIALCEKYQANNEKELARQKIKDFTKILYKNINFDYTLRMLHKNNILLTKLKKRTLSPDERINIAINEHKQMYNYLIAGDIYKACEVNRQHLYGARNLILDSMPEN